MQKTLRKTLAVFLIGLSLTGSILSSGSSAEWKLLPKGSVLEEDMVCGSLDTARKTTEKLEIQKSTIDTQDEHLQKMEDTIRAVSVQLAASQREIELLPVRMKAEIKLETRRARNEGILIGIGVAVLGFAVAR